MIMIIKIIIMIINNNASFYGLFYCRSLKATKKSHGFSAQLVRPARLSRKPGFVALVDL